MLVLVPVKRLEHCKQRLAGVLDAGQRRALMLALLDDVLREAAAATAARDVRVVTDDPAAVRAAAGHGLTAVSDGGLPWNEGLRHALETLGAAAGEAVLFLSADLPAVTAADVDALAAALPARGVAIGRARDGGTNALALRPPDALVPVFGSPASAALHAARAREAGLAATIVDRAGLALDLDTPDDLAVALADPAAAGRAWVPVVRGG